MRAACHLWKRQAHHTRNACPRSRIVSHAWRHPIRKGMFRGATQAACRRVKRGLSQTLLTWSGGETEAACPWRHPTGASRRSHPQKRAACRPAREQRNRRDLRGENAGYPGGPWRRTASRPGLLALAIGARARLFSGRRHHPGRSAHTARKPPSSSPAARGRRQRLQGSLEPAAWRHHPFRQPQGLDSDNARPASGKYSHPSFARTFFPRPDPAVSVCGDALAADAVGPTR